MMKYILVSFLLVYFGCAALFGQNGYQFIAPNISIAYDSNYFAIKNRYVNTFYNTESFDFSYRGDAAKEVTIHVSASFPADIPSRQSMDSMLLATLENLGDAKKGPLSIVHKDKAVRDINGFACIGTTGYDRKRKQYATFITGYHYTGNDRTQILYHSKGAELEQDYALLEAFLKGFKSYTKAEIDSADASLKSMYSVQVTPSPTVPDKFMYRPNT